MKHVLSVPVALVVAALAFAGAAQASTIQDLRSLGYNVGVAFTTSNGCTAYDIQGHGISTMIELCADPAVQAQVAPDSQAAIDSFANPSTIYEADWQNNHPDQVAAAQTIGGSLCYSITRVAPATDSWLLVGGGTNVTTAGVGLVSLAQSLPSVCAQNPNPVVQVVPNTDGAGNNTTPGNAGVVAQITAQAAAQQTTTNFTTTTTTTTPDAQSSAQSLAPARSTQAVTVTTVDPKTVTLAAALSLSAGQTVTLTSGTKYKLHGLFVPAAKFRTALKTRHKVKIEGTKTNGKLIAKTVTIA